MVSRLWLENFNLGPNSPRSVKAHWSNPSARKVQSYTRRKNITLYPYNEEGHVRYVWVGTNYCTISTGFAAFASPNLRQNRHYLQLCKALTPAFPVHFLIENPDGENMSDIWIARLSKQELRGTHEQAEEDVNNITLYVPPPHTTNICQSSDRHKFRNRIFNDFETLLSKWERMSYIGICKDNMQSHIIFSCF